MEEWMDDESFYKKVAEDRPCTYRKWAERNKELYFLVVASPNFCAFFNLLRPTGWGGEAVFSAQPSCKAHDPC